MKQLLVEHLPLLSAFLAVTVTLMWGRRKKPKTFDMLNGLDMGFLKKTSLRLRILATNYGRDEGWYVEDDGRRVALLTDSWFVDMFWEAYQITPLSENPKERERILNSDDLWCLKDRPRVYISRGFGLRAEFAFCSGLIEPGRVCMRGLYLPVRYPFLGRALFWLQKHFFTKQRG